MRAGGLLWLALLSASACSRGHAHTGAPEAGVVSEPICALAPPAADFDPTLAHVAAPNPSDRGMVVQLDAEPATLFPLLHPDWSSWMIEGHTVLESLVRVDARTGLLTGELAESWDVDPSRTRWTFHLRQGVTWHDGAPFTAEDVLFTFDRLLDPDIGAADRVVFAGAHVTKAGPASVEVKLPAPLASVELDFDRLLMLPRHRFPRGDLSRSQDATSPVGTGPMRFVSWTRGRELVLDRNSTYWGPLSPLSSLTFRFISSRPALLAAVDRGEIDVIPRAPIELAEHAESDPRVAKSYEVVRAGGFDYTAWIYNVTSPKLSDPRTRRAVGLMIPRAQLRSEVERCSVQLALGPLPPGHEALRGIEPPRFDPTLAAKLLGEAGVVVPFKLALVYPASSRQQERAATVVADELRRLGVVLDLEPLEWAQFMRRLETHDFELASIQWSIDAEPDLYPLFHSTQIAGAFNYGGYSDPDVDAWLEALRSEGERSRRNELLRELVLRLRRDEPYSFLFSPLVVAVVRRGSVGVAPTALGWEPRRWSWAPLDK